MTGRLQALILRCCAHQVAANLGQPGYLEDVSKATQDIDVQASGASAGCYVGSQLCKGWCRAAPTLPEGQCCGASGAAAASLAATLTVSPRPVCDLQVVFCNAGYVLTGFFETVCAGFGK